MVPSGGITDKDAFESILFKICQKYPACPKARTSNICSVKILTKACLFVIAREFMVLINYIQDVRGNADVKNDFSV